MEWQDSFAGTVELPTWKAPLSAVIRIIFVVMSLVLMMKNSGRSVAGIMLAVTLFLAGCKPDPVEPAPPGPSGPSVPAGYLKVRFVPTWENGPFSIGSTYVNVSNYRVRVDALKFYLGDVRLINGSGSTTIKDIDLFEVTNGAAEAIWSVPTGQWSAMQAGLGVPPALNASDPVLFGNDHPLSVNNGTYWTWATAYRFLMFDGRYDLDGSGSGPLNELFSMHTGLDTCYTEMDFPLDQDLVVMQDDTTTLVLELAVDRFFYSSTDTLDLATENQTHGTNLPLALELTRNAANSFMVP